MNMETRTTHKTLAVLGFLSRTFFETYGEAFCIVGASSSKANLVEKVLPK